MSKLETKWIPSLDKTSSRVEVGGVGVKIRQPFLSNLRLVRALKSATFLFRPTASQFVSVLKKTKTSLECVHSES